MNIVLTNDDGIDSLGLKKLESVLSKYGNVYVYTNTKVIAKFELSEE